MGTNDSKKIFCSMREFKKRYFPKAFEKSKIETPLDAHALGMRLARESLDNISIQISKR